MAQLILIVEIQSYVDNSIIYLTWVFLCFEKGGMFRLVCLYIAGIKKQTQASVSIYYTDEP